MPTIYSASIEEVDIMLAAEEIRSRNGFLTYSSHQGLKGRSIRLDELAILDYSLDLWQEDVKNKANCRVFMN